MKSKEELAKLVNAIINEDGHNVSTKSLKNLAILKGELNKPTERPLPTKEEIDKFWSDFIDKNVRYKWSGESAYKLLHDFAREFGMGGKTGGIDKELAGKIWDAATSRCNYGFSRPDKETFINSLNLNDKRELPAPNNGWISVEDKLPEISTTTCYSDDVIINLGSYISVGYVMAEEGWICEGIPANPTHWQPLPAPPIK